MQVTVEGQPNVLLHYSNELTDKFGRVAHYLHERAIQGPETEIPDPGVDNHTCLVCGRYIADTSSKVCPSCIQRDKVFKRLMQSGKTLLG